MISKKTKTITFDNYNHSFNICISSNFCNVESSDENVGLFISARYACGELLLEVLKIDMILGLYIQESRAFYRFYFGDGKQGLYINR